MKKWLLPLLMGVVMLAPWTVMGQMAPGPKPLVVVSLASYDALKTDVAYLGQLADFPELATTLEGMVKMITKGQGLTGWDTARPWGAAFFNEGEKNSGYVFLPVTDLGQLLDVLTPLTGKPETAGNGLYKISKDGKTTFIKAVGGWAFFSEKQESLTDLPADPQQLLGDLPRQYAVAVRLIAVNATEGQREKLIEKIRADAARGMQRRPSEPETEYALRQQMSGEVLKVIEKLIGGMEDVTLGWALDAGNRMSSLDLTLTGKEGSPIAQASSALQDARTQFAAFRLPEATLVGNWAGKTPPFKSEMLEQILQTIRQQEIAKIEKKERDPAKAEAAKKMVVQVTGLLEDTVKSGRADGGLAVLLKPQSATILAGGYLANDGRIDEMLNTLYTAAKADNPAVAEWVKFNAAQVGNVQLHSLSLPIPPDAKDREKMVALVGENLDVVIGTGKDCAYIAAGREAMPALKRVIENTSAASAEAAPPVRFSLELCRMAEFIAAEGKPHERPVAQRLAGELKKSPEADHVNLTVQPVAGGVKYRVELETGVQRALCRLVLAKILKAGP